MKSKMLKKIISCMIAGAMVTGMLAGCGSTDKPAASEETKKSEAAQESKTESSVASSSETPAESEGVTYPIDGDVELSYGYVSEPILASIADDQASVPYGQQLMEETGVTFTCVQVVDDAAMNLLFTGGDLPDIIYFDFSKYPGGAEKAVFDGIIQPITDYMEYAPDYAKALSISPNYEKGVKTSTGEIIGFTRIQESMYNQTSAGLMIRGDWLEELGLEEPQTPEEFYNVLKVFKEEKGAEAPFVVGEWWLRSIAMDQGLITSGFGLVKSDFYHVDGEVHWGCTEPEYKDVLAWLNKLYEEGLMEKNFQSIDQNTINANAMNGVSGATIGSGGGMLGLYNDTVKQSDPDTTYQMIGLRPLVEKEGDTPMSTQFSDPVGTIFAVVTTSCKDIEAAVKFLNYGYTEAGMLLNNWGKEGVTYNMVDGEPVFTDFILNNPDGLDQKTASTYYSRNGVGGPFMADSRCAKQILTDPVRNEALDKWTDTDVFTYNMPTVPILEEYLAEYTALESDIKTYVSEMTLKYITGVESLDNFESEYMATLEKMNVDRVIEIKQIALDAFYAR